MLALVPRVEPQRDSYFRAAREDSAALQPLWRTIVCDTETPVSAYAKVRARHSPAFLLESVVGGERWARYSFIGVGARARAVGRMVDGRLRVELTPGAGFHTPEISAGGAGLERLEEVLGTFRAAPAPSLPRFWGGWVGVFGHDFVRCVEEVLSPRDEDEDEDLPPVELLVTDTVVIFDNVSSEVIVVTAACPRDDGGAEAAWDAAMVRIDDVVATLRGEGASRPIEASAPQTSAPALSQAWSTGPSFQALVATAKSYIERGDVFQVVLSQRFDTPDDDFEFFDVYRALRVTNPSPYMYAFDFGDTQLVGASPEVLVRVDRSSREVTVRPIAGTRRRGDTPEEDEALERELLADPKERAEHLMLIDLGRNDVGRVSEPGTVRPSAQFVIERYSKVMHIVSEVTGTLREEVSALDALKATFPAGTLSGAPKVRALEIIDELEPEGRGWYGGAVGYLGFDGGADFAICIRSAVCRGGVVSVQAGAGIVYDSVPAHEDAECHKKASAVHVAIDMARQAERGEP
jgi:anthranilate synthase component I